MKEMFSPWGLFEGSCKKNPNNIAVIHKERSLSYAQLDDKITAFCELIKPCDFKTCAVYLPNSIEFLMCVLALNRESRVVIPFSEQLKGESLVDRIIYSDAQFIITNEKGLKELRNIAYRLQSISALVFSESGGIEHTVISQKGTVDADIPNDIFSICFTSGSTAKPKGVMISNRAISGNALAFAETIGFRADDRFLITRSLAQAGPLAGDVLMTISQGGSIILQNDLFHPAIILRHIEELGVTTTTWVGTALSQIIEYPRFEEYDIRSLRRIVFGGMSTPEKVVKKAVSKMPKVDFLCTYGLTEASTRVTVTAPSDISEYPNSVGKPIKGCSVTIYRKDGSAANHGEIGDVYVESDYIMKGYYKNQVLTGEKLTARGLRTGDAGYADSSGMLYICGRNDNVIIQGGNNVFPAEVEDILYRNAYVLEAVVVGFDDDRLGQRIVAAVVVNDEEIRDEDIYKWCKANMEEKKLPREIYVIKEIPKSETGKTDRTKLIERIRELRGKIS